MAQRGEEEEGKRKECKESPVDPLSGLATSIDFSIEIETNTVCQVESGKGKGGYDSKGERRASSPLFAIPTTADGGSGPSQPLTQTTEEGGRQKEREAEREAERAVSKKSVPTAVQKRLEKYKASLQPDVLHLPKLQEMAFFGVPEQEGTRAMYWKVLLNYLPLKKCYWEDELRKRRKLYSDFVEELVIDPEAAREKSRSEEIDHPLSSSDNSRWNGYFKDKRMLGEIEKDVRRTFPNLHFFHANPEDGPTIHYKALRQILFIYAKLNPGINYVQGMNEILGPIYYIFASDPCREWAEHAEADAFFCFTNLMSEIMDNFCKSLDKSDIGIRHRIKQYNLLLKRVDPKLWENLESKQLSPEFYSFRWLTLLLSQEFELPDVLRLWDSLFADAGRFTFMLYVCCAMVKLQRQQIIEESFAENLKLLQDYPPTDINEILKLAAHLFRTHPPRHVGLA